MLKRIIPFAILLIMCLVLTACWEQKTYSVSGRVIDDSGVGLEEVRLIFTEGFSGVMETGVNGFWSMSGLRKTVRIVPQRSGWSFEPAYRVVTDMNTQVDFTGTWTEPDDVAQVITQYANARSEEDALMTVDCLHDIYLEYKGYSSREEYIAFLEESFQERNITYEIEIHSEDLWIDGERASLPGTTTIYNHDRDTFSESEYVYHLIKTEAGWQIAFLGREVDDQIAYNKMVKKFMNGYRQKDVELIAECISPNYSDETYPDRTAFLEYLEGFVQAIDIYDYIVTQTGYGKDSVDWTYDIYHLVEGELQITAGSTITVQVELIDGQYMIKHLALRRE